MRLQRTFLRSKVREFLRESPNGGKPALKRWMEERDMEFLTTGNVRWADPFYVWGDNLMGYSRLDKGANFWDEWQPQPTKTRRVVKKRRWPYI